MSFSWPWLLFLFLLIPIMLAVYIWILRRKRKFAVRYSSLALIRAALPRRNRLRQHLPFMLFLLALAAIVTAAARPAAELEVPLSRTTIILALDVSRSMCATDVDPNRLTVAQEAALAFVEDVADDTRIGLVAFAGFAEIVVPPTNDKEVLTQAIENFTTSLGTAIGSATLKSIDAIAEVNEAVDASGIDLRPVDPSGPLDIDYLQPDIIVVLTDGANTQGPAPLEAALQAAGRQVRVYTIGFGTTNPQQMVCTQEQLGSDSFTNFGGNYWGSGGIPGGVPGGGSGGGSGRGFGGNFRRYLLLDEPTLQGMAEITGGEYYRAENAEQLYEVFVNLPTEFVLQKEKLEISFLFSLLGAIFATTAVGLSLAWHRYP